MQVSVFGLGYVGCVTAACLARLGHDVCGVDINQDKVSMVNSGTSPLVEPGLGDLLKEVVANKRLRATTSCEEAVQNSELAMICVGTPGRSNGQLNVEHIERIGREIGHALRRRRRAITIVLRSTVLPGTTESVLAPALQAGAEEPFSCPVTIAVNPEFLREGSALKDFTHPPLTLVGCNDAASAAQVESLYMGIESQCVRSEIRTAEMMKYVSNSFHALKICFANEIGNLCAAFGVDAHEVIQIFLMDRKLNISDAYLRPGFAFGGSCLPKDVRALAYAGRSADVTVPVLSSILHSNEAQIRRGVEAVLDTRKRKIGVVGLSFKPRTDDLRESPMVTLVETLIGKGCDVRILDQNVSIARLVGANRRYIEEEIPHISSLMCDGVDALLKHAEVLVLGNADEQAVQVLARSSLAHTLIDLTQGAVSRMKIPGRSDE